MTLFKKAWMECLLAHSIQALCADPPISSAYHAPHFTSYLLFLTSRLHWKASVRFIYNDVCEAPCVTMGTCTSGIHSKFLKTLTSTPEETVTSPVLCHLSLECGPFSSRHYPFVCLTEQLLDRIYYPFIWILCVFHPDSISICFLSFFSLHVSVFLMETP